MTYSLSIIDFFYQLFKIDSNYSVTNLSAAEANYLLIEEVIKNRMEKFDKTNPYNPNAKKSYSKKTLILVALFTAIFFIVFIYWRDHA